MANLTLEIAITEHHLVVEEMLLLIRKLNIFLLFVFQVEFIIIFGYRSSRQNDRRRGRNQPAGTFEQVLSGLLSNMSRNAQTFDGNGPV